MHTTLTKRISRLLATLVLCTGALAGMGSAAGAHSELVSSSPAADSTSTSPETVELTFGAGVEETMARIAVTSPSGERIDSGNPTHTTTDDAMLSVAITPTESGTHTVDWRVVSEDGHPINGSFSFTAEVPATTTTAGPGEETPSTSAVETAPASDAQGAASEESSGNILPIVGIVLALCAVVAFIALRPRT
jgi:copper resistance protein C